MPIVFDKPTATSLAAQIDLVVAANSDFANQVESYPMLDPVRASVPFTSSIQRDFTDNPDAGKLKDFTTAQDLALEPYKFDRVTRFEGEISVTKGQQGYELSGGEVTFTPGLIARVAQLLGEDIANDINNLTVSEILTDAGAAAALPGVTATTTAINVKQLAAAFSRLKSQFRRNRANLNSLYMWVGDEILAQLISSNVVNTATAGTQAAILTGTIGTFAGWNLIPAPAGVGATEVVVHTRNAHGLASRPVGNGSDTPGAVAVINTAGPVRYRLYHFFDGNVGANKVVADYFRGVGSTVPGGAVSDYNKRYSVTFAPESA